MIRQGYLNDNQAQQQQSQMNRTMQVKQKGGKQGTAQASGSSNARVNSLQDGAKAREQASKSVITHQDRESPNPSAGLSQGCQPKIQKLNIKKSQIKITAGGGMGA